MDNTLALSSATRLNYADQSFEAVVLPFLLHKTNQPEAALAEAFRLAPRVVIIDWKLPERNLDYFAYLPLLFCKRCFSRSDNFKNFRRFMEQGGAEGVVQRYEQAIIVQRSFLRFGSVVKLEIISPMKPAPMPGLASVAGLIFIIQSDRTAAWMGKHPTRCRIHGLHSLP
jgi:hypothetical protein